MPKSTEIKNQVCKCHNQEDLFKVLDDYEQYIRSNYEL